MLILLSIVLIVLIVLLAYVILLRYQLRNITRQLMEQSRISRITDSRNVHIALVDRTLIQLVASINDILERERQIKVAAARTEQQQKEAIAGISHDFRTPLTSMIGYLQLHLAAADDDDGDDNEYDNEYVQTALEKAYMLNGLINQFYELSLLHEGDGSVALQQVNLSNTLTEIILEHADLFEEKQLSPSLIGLRQPIHGMVDPLLLPRIMQNLIANCAQYAAGDVTFELIASDQIILSVRNIISGTHTLDVNRLFDKFYVGDGGRSGSGIGLTIVKALVEHMGGRWLRIWMRPSWISA